MRLSLILALGFLLAIGTTRGAFAQETTHEGKHAAPATPAPSGSAQATDTAQPMDKMGMKMGQKGMEKGQKGMGMGQGEMGMQPMDEQMKALHDHSKMMEGVTDPKKLDAEMKKQMMDDMMETMMKSHPSAPAAAPTAPHPSGGHM